MNVNKKVIKTIESRIEAGKKKYGNQIPMNGAKFRDNFKEAIEEALDLSVYLAVCTFEKQEWLERYKLAYFHFMEYWDDIPEDKQDKLNKKLRRLGL